MAASNFNPYGVTIPTENGNVTLVAGANVRLQPQGTTVTISALIPPTVVTNGVTAYNPPSIKDTDAQKGTLYYSTTSNKLSFCDYSGVIHALY